MSDFGRILVEAGFTWEEMQAVLESVQFAVVLTAAGEMEEGKPIQVPLKIEWSQEKFDALVRVVREAGLSSE